MNHLVLSLESAGSSVSVVCDISDSAESVRGHCNVPECDNDGRWPDGVIDGWCDGGI